MSDLWLIRHGETEWSANGRHTGRTDIALTPGGERQADLLRRRLGGRTFAEVRTSPLRRARDTCRIAGYADRALVDDDLCEWDYGEVEGRTPAEVRARHPGWTLWDDGVPAGETLAQVGARVDRVIAGVLGAPGDVALFAHGHLLRILAARWIGLAAVGGRSFTLNTASVSILGRDRDRVVSLWNDVSHLAEGR